MSDLEDLKQADFWAAMAFNKDAPDDELRKRFRSFSLRADKMLLDDWKDFSDKRMLEVKKIMIEVIKEKENPGLFSIVKDMFR